MPISPGCFQMGFSMLVPFLFNHTTLINPQRDKEAKFPSFLFHLASDEKEKPEIEVAFSKLKRFKSSTLSQLQ